MRKTILLIAGPLLIASILMAAAAAASKPFSMNGWVSDESCGAEHTKAGREDCVRKCLRGGADIGHPEWKPQRMVFVADRDKRIWIVENPEALKGQEGRHVKITGQLNASSKTVKVETVRTLK
ncbi:MAG TPA: hypothetical protein VGB17_15380 [Pyrinomonadaceae bacterium]|jgi:hypothetical protein